MQMRCSQENFWVRVTKTSQLELKVWVLPLMLEGMGAVLRPAAPAWPR